MIILLLILNFGIAWWNCYAVGGMWNESKMLGGFSRILAWSAAIQSAIGFSMVFGAIFGVILKGFGYLPDKVAELAMAFWYLTIIIPAIGSGLIITIHSWCVAIREKSLLDFAVAGYNTYAQYQNMASAMNQIPDLFGKIVDVATDDEDGGGLILAAILLALSSLAAGVVLTMVLIKKYSNRLPYPQIDKGEVK